jgi:hypothetical protein
MDKRSNRLTYANVVATLALVLVIAGGTAYAANTVLSGDIVDNQVYSADVRNDGLSGGGLAAQDLQAGAVGTSEVLNDTLAGGGLAAADLRSGSVGPAEAAGLGTEDIANASGGSDNINANKLDGLDSSGLVQGRGKVLASRFIMAGDAPDRTMFEIPGLGRLSASCGFAGAVLFDNTTSGAVDFWIDGPGDPSHKVIPSLRGSEVASIERGPEASTVALGFGDDPGARRTATVHAFVAQAGADQPCTVQAQAMLWTVDE